MKKLVKQFYSYFIQSKLIKRNATLSHYLDEDNWHSWDPHPWDHPWLTNDNLKAARQFSDQFFEIEKRSLEQVDCKQLHIGFVGNIANSMYVRALPLLKDGFSIDLFLHPQDRYVMSYPWWEDFNGTIQPNEANIDNLLKTKLCVPSIDNVYQLPELNYNLNDINRLTFLRSSDIHDFPNYFRNLSTLKRLQAMDVIWATQYVYLGYLSNKPYVASQSGGDIWLEASRGDELGRVQRKAFAKARVILVSNPWTYAHARRFGFKHLVYLPKTLDETVYKPASGNTRSKWIEESGGDFFVLTSSRLDEKNKGSNTGIYGFAAFSKSHPNARLVVIGWGKDLEKKQETLYKLGIQDRVIVLPVSGKALIRDYLRSADVFIDQFVLGYFGSAGLEAMACGLPVVSRIESSQYDALCNTGAPPIINVDSEYGVCEALSALANNEGLKKELSHDHRQWFLDNHGSEKWHDTYQAIFAATSSRLVNSFTDSPLNGPLSDEEKQYHSDGLADAPPHPHYGW